MCGILGGNVKNWNYEEGILAIKHRGPDSQKVIEYPLCTLAFARLSIIDLSENAMQPMSSSDGLVNILFNGEIYGFEKLRRKLERKWKFNTKSDTEVVLNAYMEYGDKFVDYLDGMFAIAIYDKRYEVIKLYRDRYGIKPLYYYCDNSNFAFASEIKAFLAADKSKKWEIDKTALYDYLCYQYVPEPKSIYKKIYKLEPANFLTYDLLNKKVVCKDRYWHLHVNTNKEKRKSDKDVADELRALVKESVKEQMVADVNVGTFLSGGIDSSVITYECNQIKENVEAYSIGFTEPKYDESRYSRIFVDKYDINQRLKYVNSKDVKDLCGLLRTLYDEPFADTSAYPTYIVSKYACKNVRVVLTGDAGDELFGGYERYNTFVRDVCNKSDKLNDFIKNVKFVKKNNLLNRLCSKELKSYGRLVLFNEEDQLIKWKKLLGIDKTYDTYWYLRKYWVEDLPPITRMRYLDFKTYLPSDNLAKVDRACMGNSLEARIPFLNRKIVEFVFSLAQDDVCGEKNLKRILKNAYEGIIPSEILYRKKKGFSIPDSYVRLSNREETKYMKLLKTDWNDIYRESGLYN